MNIIHPYNTRSKTQNNDDDPPSRKKRKRVSISKTKPKLRLNDIPVESESEDEKNVNKDEEDSSDSSCIEESEEDTTEVEEEENEEEDNEEEDNEEEDEKASFGHFLGQILCGKNNMQKMLLKRLRDSSVPEPYKTNLSSQLQNANLDNKRIEWFDVILKIPFGSYKTISKPKKKNSLNYFKNVMTTLDNSVYGLSPVKEEIFNYLVQSISSPNYSSRMLALQGGPGVGKTKLIRDGISKVLNRPMKCFSMGGIKDSHQFTGFEFTYIGSKQGMLVQALIDSEIMNPIIFFDELDKISKGYDGDEIENFLIHLTDPVQNHDFHDKFIDSIPIDLSKVFFIFAFNDINAINPILKDRLHIIKIPDPSTNDKLHIARKYILKDLFGKINVKETDFSLDDSSIKYIIKEYTSQEKGVRKLSRCLETILLKINTLKVLEGNVKEFNLSFSKENITFPICLDEKQIDVFLKDIERDEKRYLSMYA